MLRRVNIRRQLAAIAGAAALVVAAAGCAPSSSDNDSELGGAGLNAKPAKNFDLEKLIDAAKKEGSVTVYDSTGDIVDVAKAFEAKYGIKALGVKSKTGNTLEKMTREHDAGNVTIDATLFEDGPGLVGQMLPQKVVKTWIPPDLAKDIKVQNPLLVLTKANVWAYNTNLYPDGCPVDSVWDLTKPEWKGKVMMQDPAGKSNIIEFFNQLNTSGNDDLEAAYKTEYGKDLAPKEESVAKQWVADLVKNGPILTDSDDDIAQAVGSPKQDKPRVGLMSASKFRDIEESGLEMAACEGMEPWLGFQYPKWAAVATQTEHPNAAKLFIHFVFTPEGIAPEMQEQGISGNSAIPQSEANPPGLTDWSTQLFSFNPADIKKDFDNQQDMLDFWTLNRG